MEKQRPTGKVVSGAQRNLKVIAQTPDVRIVEYTLNPDGRHPWHHHTQVTDRIYCLEGLIAVDTMEPAEQFRLRPGESCEARRQGPPREQSNGRHEPVPSRPGIR